jgi:hypothetical protein
MRKILLATLIVAGMGFVGTSSASAAPANTGVLQQLTEMNNSNVTQFGWHRRWRSHHRWGSRGGGGGGGGRCHVRFRSWWHWC